MWKETEKRNLNLRISIVESIKKKKKKRSKFEREKEREANQCDIMIKNDQDLKKYISRVPQEYEKFIYN